MQVLPSKTGVLINIVADINDCVRAGLDIKNDKTHLRAEQLCTFSCCTQFVAIDAHPVRLQPCSRFRIRCTQNLFQLLFALLPRGSDQ